MIKIFFVVLIVIKPALSSIGKTSLSLRLLLLRAQDQPVDQHGGEDDQHGSVCANDDHDREFRVMI